MAPRVALALGIFALAGASIGLAMGLDSLADVHGFLKLNGGSAAERNQILALMAGGGLSGLTLGVFPLLWSGMGTFPRVWRMAQFISPLCLAGLMPVLFSARTWDGPRLTFLALLGITVCVAERLFANSFAAVPSYVSEGVRRIEFAGFLRRHGALLTVLAGALAYAVYFSHYTLVHHRRFGTSAFDLGINVNWCANALEGQWFRTTVLFGPDGGSMIAGHAIFAVFLWLPFFALWPGAESLLIYQSVMVGLAAVPLYLFAQTQLPRWSAALVALAYLLYAPLHGPNFYDFHELPVALPWHFLLYYLIAINRLRWAALVAVILCAHREDMAVGLCVLGLFLLLSGARPRFGTGLAVVSAVWFVIDKFVIMPMAGSWWFANIYKDLMPGGQGGYGQVVQTILINPAYFVTTLLTQDKLIYFLHMFAPLVFLPLRRPLLAMLTLPGLFFALMTTGYAPTLSIAFQYTTHWIPYVFGASVLALRVIGRGGMALQRGALCALVLGVLAHSAVFGAVFNHQTFVGGFSGIQFTETESEKRDYAEFKRLIANIPHNVSIAASDSELPHVAARVDVYTLRQAHGDADYLLVRKGGAFTQKILQAAFDRNDYGLVGKAAGKFFLFKKGHQSPETRKATSQLRIRVKGG